MKNWYLVYCNYNQEDRAIINLERQGVQVFCPMFSQDNHSPHKKGGYIFPRYLFCLFNPEVISKTTINSTRGVSQLIKFGGRQEIIPRMVIENLMFYIERSPEADFKGEGSPNLKNLSEKVSAIIKGIFSECESDKRVLLFFSLYSLIVRDIAKEIVEIPVKK